jgi:hypothetical protein
MKETSEALHLENSFVWFRNLDTSENDLDGSEMWCWRRTEKFGWTDRVKTEEVLHRAENNILHNILRRKGILMGHILNMLLKKI